MPSGGSTRARPRDLRRDRAAGGSGTASEEPDRLAEVGPRGAFRFLREPVAGAVAHRHGRGAAVELLHARRNAGRLPHVARRADSAGGGCRFPLAHLALAAGAMAEYS